VTVSEAENRELLERACWYMVAIPASKRLRQENHEFKVSLDYTVRPCLKNSKSKQASKQVNPKLL
jgi:hypothetical protein